MKKKNQEDQKKKMHKNKIYYVGINLDNIM